jgi:hypothetical protein
MRVFIFVGLSLMAVRGLAASAPCFQSPDFVSTCPQPESRVLAAPGGTRVTITIVSGEVNATQEYGGVPISYVTRRSNGLTEIGRADGTARIGFLPVVGTTRMRVYVNGAYFGYLDRANAAVTQATLQNLVISAVMPPFQLIPPAFIWFDDLNWAFKAGWASSACNMATLKAQGAALLALGAAVKGNPWAAVSLIALYFEALEAQAVACGMP